MSFSPLLVCLDLERLFSEPGTEYFIPDVEQPLRVCERVLLHARRQRWRIAHCYRSQKDPVASRPIRGFEPHANEMIFRRAAPSPYSVAPFEREMERCAGAPAFLIGFASACQVLATVLDAVARQQRMMAIFEAIHTPAAGGVGTAELNAAALTVLKGLHCGFSAEEFHNRHEDFGDVRVIGELS